MKIEALERIKSDGYVLDAGDIKVNIPDAIGAAWCSHGWARDLDGAVATGARQVIDARIDVQPAASGQLTQEA